MFLNATEKVWKVEGGFKEGKKHLKFSTGEVYESLEGTGFFMETTPLITNNCLNKKSLPVYSYGMNICDRLYVEDPARLLIMAE